MISREIRHKIFGVLFISFIVFFSIGAAIYGYGQNSQSDREDINLLTIEVRTDRIIKILQFIRDDINQQYQIQLPPIKFFLDINPADELSWGFWAVSKEMIHFIFPLKLFVSLNDEEIAAVIVHELGHLDMKRLPYDMGYPNQAIARDIEQEIRADLFAAQFIDPKIISSAIVKLASPQAEQEKYERLLALSNINSQ